MPNETPIWGYELKDYINIGTSESPQWIEATNLLSWEFSDDQQTYEPDYIDVSVSPTFVLGNKASIEYEKDAYRENELDAWLIEHEDDSSIPVEIARVRSWEPSGIGSAAKMATFALTPQQLDKNSSGEPVKLKGTLSKTGDWARGSFDESTPQFSADEEESGQTGSTGSTGQTGETGATGASYSAKAAK